MTELEILVDGYARETENGWIASSTTVLIQENGLNIIADPGINRKMLQDGLSKANISPENVDYFFLTHHHLDHCYLSAIFENAKALDSVFIYENDKEIEHQGIIPGTSLKIIHTPGHVNAHASLIVPTKNGVYTIAGDVFWWVGDEEQKLDKDSLILHNAPLSENKESLINSRKRILEIADYIIPGHGKPFQMK